MISYMRYIAVFLISTLIFLPLTGHTLVESEPILTSSISYFDITKHFFELSYGQPQYVYVDDDNVQGPWDGSNQHPYQYIQEGIDACYPSDIVFVREGIYYENILINKTISLCGEEKNSTIIDGGKVDDVVIIESDNVHLSGFTIQNSSNDLDRGIWRKAGIRIIGSLITVEDTIIQDNLQGLFIKRGMNIIIKNNHFFNDGVTIFPYDGVDTSRPPIQRSYFDHVIENNMVNGKPLLYLIDETDVEISSDIGQLLLVNCSNIIVRDINISHTDFPLMLIECTHCRIENVSVFDNEGICTLFNSHENHISFCVFERCLHGFLFDYHSERNIMEFNSFLKNQFCGVVCEYYSNGNYFYKNDFIDNNYHNAFVICAFKNTWESNYWSDWIGLDHAMFQHFPKMIRGSLFQNHQQIPSLFNIDKDPMTAPIH